MFDLIHGDLLGLPLLGLLLDLVLQLPVLLLILALLLVLEAADVGLRALLDTPQECVLAVERLLHHIVHLVLRLQKLLQIVLHYHYFFINLY